LERHHAWKEIFSAPQRQSLLAAPGDGWDPLDIYRDRYAETAGAEPLARLQDVDLGIYLVDDLLVKTDRASMAHSLELRVPFLDPAVAGLALELPTRHKVRGLAKKRLLRRALAPLLPKEVVRGRKQGFSIPLAAWLRGPLGTSRAKSLSRRDAGAAGLPRPATASPACSTATAPAARTSAASSGA
jgi:asparagine synthase (glutamine-hydrolysing)